MAHAQSLGKALIAAVGDEFENILRVDAAAVVQHHALLKVVEQHVAVAGAGGVVVFVLEVQAFHGLAFHDGGDDDLFSVFGLHADVEEAAGVADDQRADFAEAVAAGDDDVHLVVQAMGVDGGLKGVLHRAAAGGMAAGAAADEDLMLFFVGLAVVVAQADKILGLGLQLGEGGNGSEAFEFKHIVLSFSPDSCRGCRGCRWGSGGRGYCR